MFSILYSVYFLLFTARAVSVSNVVWPLIRCGDRGLSVPDGARQGRQFVTAGGPGHHVYLSRRWWPTLAALQPLHLPWAAHMLRNIPKNFQ